MLVEKQNKTPAARHLKDVSLTIRNPFFNQPTFERIIQKNQASTSRPAYRYKVTPQKNVNFILQNSDSFQKYKIKGSSFDEKIKKYGFVSTKAVKYFYKTYKAIAKLNNKNTYLSIQESAHASFISNCEKQKINPKLTGIVKYRGRSNELNIQHQSVGDKYAKAISKAIKQIDEIEVFKLADNRLSDSGISSIIKNMSPKTKQIELSNNSMGLKSL